MDHLFRKPKIAFMFPGQGCQYYRMGLPLYEQYAFFRNWIDNCREILWDIARIDLLQEVLYPQKSKADLFHNLRVSQPALIIIAVGIAKLLQANGLIPDLILGTSLGEIAAALFAEVWDVETLIRTVCAHVEDFIHHCPAGLMISLFNAENKFDLIEYEKLGFGLAARNFPGNIVIAGPRVRESAIDAQLSGIEWEKLPIAIAFHSKHVEAARVAFFKSLQQLTFNRAIYPIYSAALVDRVALFDSAYLWKIIREPIYFSDLVQVLEESHSYCYIDVGPSGVLSNFVKYNLSYLNPMTISQSIKFLTPFTNNIDLNLFTLHVKQLTKDAR